MSDFLSDYMPPPDYVAPPGRDYTKERRKLLAGMTIADWMMAAYHPSLYRLHKLTMRCWADLVAQQVTGSHQVE